MSYTTRVNRSEICFILWNFEINCVPEIMFFIEILFLFEIIYFANMWILYLNSCLGLKNCILDLIFFLCVFFVLFFFCISNNFLYLKNLFSIYCQFIFSVDVLKNDYILFRKWFLKYFLLIILFQTRFLLTNVFEILSEKKNILYFYFIL